MDNKIYITGYFKSDDIIKSFKCLTEFELESKTQIQMSNGDFHSAILVKYDYISHLFPRLSTLLQIAYLSDVCFHFDC